MVNFSSESSSGQSSSEITSSSSSSLIVIETSSSLAPSSSSQSSFMVFSSSSEASSSEVIASSVSSVVVSSSSIDIESSSSVESSASSVSLSSVFSSSSEASSSEVIASSVSSVVASSSSIDIESSSSAVSSSSSESSSTVPSSSSSIDSSSSLSSASSEASSSSAVVSSSVASSSSSQIALAPIDLSVQLESFDISSAYAQFVLQHGDGAIVDDILLTLNNMPDETNYADALEAGQVAIARYVDRNSINTVTFDASNTYEQSDSFTARFFLGTEGDDEFIADASLNVFVGYQGTDTFVGNDQRNIFYYDQRHDAVTINADPDAVENSLRLGFSFSQQALRYYRLGDDLIIEGETAGSKITLLNWFDGEAAPIIDIWLYDGEPLEIASEDIITMPAPPLLFLALTPERLSVDSAGNVVLSVSVMEGDRPIVSVTETYNNESVDILGQLDEGLYQLVFSPDNLVGENHYTFTVTDDFGQQSASTALLIAGMGEADTLTGDADHNAIWGSVGDEKISVTAGDNVISGGQGDDILIGGSGFDTFIFRSNDGADIVYAQREQDVIRFIDVIPEQVRLVRAQNENDVELLVVSNGASVSQITLVNQLAEEPASLDYSGVRGVIFADGSEWSDVDIESIVLGAEINFSLFTDEALRACVRATGALRIAELTQLNCSETGISDLAGVEQLTALEFLDLSANRLTSVDLSRNTALIDLNLAQNQLTAIDVSANTSLAYLALDDNQLAAIDISENINLTDLYIAGNGINCFDIQNLIAEFETVSLQDCITVPNDFTFEAKAGAELNRWIASDAVTIMGIISEVDISIIGGEFSLDGGQTFTAEAGVVAPNTDVVVRVKTPQAFDATVQATLDVGGVTSSFSVTTRSREQCENLVPLVLDDVDARAVSVSSIYSDQYPGRLAFDDDDRTSWISEVGQAPAWVAYDFQQPAAVTQYTIQFANGSLTSRAPKVFSLQGTNGGGWVTLDTQDSEENWAGVETRTYTLEQPSYFRQYRLFVSDDNHPNEGIVVISIAGLLLENCGELPDFDRVGASVPDEFDIAAKTEVEPGSSVFSDVIEVSGLAARTSISIDGGEYSLDGGQTFTGAAGFVEPQATVIVRMESSPLLEGKAEARLEIGGVLSTFSATTRSVSDTIDLELFSDLALYDCIKATGVTEISRLTNLTCEDAGIIDASGIEQLTALNSLNLRYNALKTIDVSKLTELTSLILNENQISEIDVSENSELKTLWLSQNQLAEIDLSSNGALISLLLNDNLLLAVDLSSNSALVTLWLSGNQLSRIDLSKNVELTDVLLYQNKLTTIDVSNNVALMSLNLSRNALTDIDVSNNTALTRLSLDQNQLSMVDVTMNAELSYLNLTSNELSSINTFFNPVLTSLNLSGNPLGTIDVSMNAELTSLVLQNSQLKAIDVSRNAALKSLNLRYNQLTDIDVSMNANLEVLYLLGNEASCEYFREITSPYLKEGVLDCPIAN
ncbi:MAG TPA: discoidin domain-containing protein [Marinagarivorans sp.]